MPPLTQRSNADAVARFCLVILLALACALPAAAQNNDEEPGAEPEQYAAIVLPDNPTRQQTQAYIAELVKLNDRLGELGGFDYSKRIEFLATYQKFDAVPDQQIDLLISNLRQWYVKPEIANSIARRDKEVIKPIIIAGLDKHPANIIAIRHFGWYDDAKEPIMRKLEKTDTMKGLANDDNWLHAFAYAAEPKHYAKFKQLFVTSFRRSQRVGLLESMPGYDILDTIQACIVATEKNLASGDPQGDYTSQIYIELERLWVIAARAGDVDALGELIDVLNNRKPEVVLSYFRVGDFDMQRDNVTQFIEFKGSNKEIAQWFKANRDKLVFDAFKNRFVVGEAF